jgi:2-polyprenyl-3-methyl-5-hydroxy-6-metoxy-1,4-benzoquinol methylase
MTVAEGLEGAQLFYERFADEFDDRMNEYEVRKRLDLVFGDVLSGTDLHGLQFLDAGCGTGLFSAMAVERGATVTSLDVGEALLARVAEKCDSTRVVGDLAALPFADASFDIVMSTEVIEHLAQPVDGVRELVRVLRPGGRLVLTTPNRTWLPAIRLANVLKLRPYEGLENWVSRTQLRSWLEALGLTIERLEGFNLVPFVHPSLYGLNDRLDAAAAGPAGAAAINTLVVARQPA